MKTRRKHSKSKSSLKMVKNGAPLIDLETGTILVGKHRNKRIDSLRVSQINGINGAYNGLMTQEEEDYIWRFLEGKPEGDHDSDAIDSHMRDIAASIGFA